MSRTGLQYKTALHTKCKPLLKEEISKGALNEKTHWVVFTSTIENRPQRTPDSKGGTGDNRERNVINSTNSTSQTDEDGSDEVANPHAQPGVPPCETAASDH